MVEDVSGYSGGDNVDRFDAGLFAGDAGSCDFGTKDKPAALSLDVARMCRDSMETDRPDGLGFADRLKLLKKDLILPRHPEAFELSEGLAEMVVVFCKKLQIPMNFQEPRLFVQDGKLVMKGLLFSPAMKEAFLRIGPEVQLIEPDNEERFLYEVYVDIGFFERLVLAELEQTRGSTFDRVASVVDMD